MYYYKCQRCDNIQKSKEPPEFIHMCNNCERVDIRLYGIDIRYLPIRDIIQKMEEELIRRRKRQPLFLRYIWTQKDKTEIELNDMKEEHLVNTIHLLRRKIKES